MNQNNPIPSPSNKPPLTPPVPATTSEPTTKTNTLQKSLLKQIIDVAVSYQDNYTTKMNGHLEGLTAAQKVQTTLLSLKEELLTPDNNGKSKDNNRTPTENEKKLVAELAQMGVTLPALPTVDVIDNAMEKSRVTTKHTYQKLDDLGRDKNSVFDVAKEIMRMVNRSISGIIERMTNR